MNKMRTQLITLSLLLLSLTAEAQHPFLSREAYQDKVEAYSQILKQQKLKTIASAEARKIAHTGFLPKIDINADGTLNMSDLKAWNEPLGNTVTTPIKEYSSSRNLFIQEEHSTLNTRLPKRMKNSACSMRK